MVIGTYTYSTFLENLDIRNQIFEKDAFPQQEGKVGNPNLSLNYSDFLEKFQPILLEKIKYSCTYSIQTTNKLVEELL